MHIDNDGLAACPSCGAPMRFSRTISLINDAAKMRIFECKPCRLVITAEHLLQVPKLADAKPLVA
jgi:predicted  nucleic acid-binding Zn ribbon protein